MITCEEEAEYIADDMRNLLAALDIAGDILNFKKLGMTDLEIALILKEEYSPQAAYIATKHSTRH